MKSKTVIEKRIDDLLDRNWLYYDVEDGEDIEFVDIYNDETINAAAKEWEISPKAVRAMANALHGLVEDFVEMLSKDLEDIWEQVE